MSQPAVTVCFPVRNGAHYIAEALQALSEQTFSDFEVCLQDNASTDATLDIVSRFVDPRVIVERNEIDLGFAKNLSLSFERANGRYVKFHCHDDLLEPQCLEREVAFMKTHPEVGVVFTDFVFIDESGRTLPNPFEQIYAGLPCVLDPQTAAAMYCQHGCVTMFPSAMARRDILGQFDVTLGSATDWGKWADILQKGASIGFLHEKLIRLRTHPGQLSFVPAQSAYFEGCYRILDRLEALLPPGAHGKKLRARHSANYMAHAVKLALAGQVQNAAKVVSVVAHKDSIPRTVAILLSRVTEKVGRSIARR